MNFQHILLVATKKVTIVTIMVTKASKSLIETLFGKVRRNVLRTFFAKDSKPLHLREIARITDCGIGGLQRELGALVACGILKRRKEGNQVYYSVEESCPVVLELRSLFKKTSGLADLLKSALAQLDDKISISLVFGSVAANKETNTSDLDLLIVGDVSFGEIIDVVTPRQDRICREINPVVMDDNEFRNRYNEKDYFIHDIERSPKLYIKGTDDDFARLAR